MKQSYKSYKGTKADTKRIHIIITLAVMVFIFIHSAMPGEVSGGESSIFAQFLASITGLSFETAHFIVRKAAHFTEFAILGICLTANFNDLTSRNGLASRNEPTNKELTDNALVNTAKASAAENMARQALMRHPLLAAWITGTLYACTDEFHQRFVADRSCEFRDACIDAAGVAFGIAIATLIKRIKTRNSVR